MPKAFLALLLTVSASASLCAQTYGDYPIQGVPFSDVHLSDAFWAPRIVQNREVTIPIATRQCYDTGRVANFLKAAAILKGSNIGWFNTEYTFDDTDIYKLLEGMAYSYAMQPDPVLRDSMNTLIDIVAAAQEPDGYLYTARTAGQPGHLHSWVGAERWVKDPDLSHELYNAGHLFEAAAAHYQATGERSLLTVATRFADLLVKEFLKGGKAYEPGHQIVEMGLVKMYRVTGNQDYLRLAKYFLDIRGVGGPGSLKSAYCQSHIPPADQREAVGHAVRATYMYSGMADVAAIMGDSRYLTAIEAIWENIAEKKYYITGGIGARHNGEAFGDAYELPNLSAYNETCAAIANVYWNWRMFLLSGDSKYYDVLERTLYNGVLSGISLSGDHFFYPNPLESRGSYSRSAWFGCACCPSNLCRFLASVPGYIYAHRADSVYVNLFAQGKAVIQIDERRTLTLTQKTDYPWEGNINISIEKYDNDNALPFTLMIRLPGWAQGRPVPSDLYSYVGQTKADIQLLVNGAPVSYTMHQGYMVVSRVWQEGDKVSFSLPMDVHRVVARDNVADDQGLVALERGPIVYCLEWPDNQNEVFSSIVTDDAEIKAVPDATTFADFGTKVMTLSISGQNKIFTEDDRISTEPRTFTAIPYYTWANRGEGNMSVWLPRSASKADVSMNHVAHTDTLHIEVAQVPTTGSYSSGYPSQLIPTDRSRVSKTLGVSYSQLTTLLGSELTYALVEPNGNINTNSTAGAPGHWMGADGHAVAWVSNPAAITNATDVPYVFSEFQKDSYALRIGQYPKLCQEGDSYHFRQAVTRVPAKGVPRRVVFDVHLTITDANNMFDAAVRYAQNFLDDDHYAEVTGNTRTALARAVKARPTTEASFATATEKIYSTLATFIERRTDDIETEARERIIDEVDAGETTSETAHNGKFISGSNTGTYKNETWRDTPAKGYVQYTLFNTKGITDDVFLNLRFTLNDAGRSAIATIDGHQLCELFVPKDIKGKDVNGFYEVEYPIPASMLTDADGKAKSSFTFRFTATGTASIPGIFYLRLVKGSELEPYRFQPSDWQSGDLNRVSNACFEYSDEAITIEAGTGDHNVCLSLNIDETDYFLTGNSNYFVVRGSGLSIDTGKNLLWWFNGINKGTSEAAAFAKLTDSGEAVIAWNLATCPLNTNSRGAFWNFSTGTTCFGLTATTGTAVINHIGFTDNISEYFNTIVGLQDVELSGAHKPANKQFYDLSGRRVRNGPLPKGIYVTNGQKVYRSNGRERPFRR